jgi:CheY-like chemotaxis protein
MSAPQLLAIRADPYGVDLILTDFNMPDDSGLERAREFVALRRVFRSSSARVSSTMTCSSAPSRPVRRESWPRSAWNNWDRC